MTQNKVNKKFVYLISPNKIKNNQFYTNLEKVLKTKKVSFFQLRLKKTTNKNRLIIGKKYLKFVKNIKLNFSLMMILNLLKN